MAKNSYKANVNQYANQEEAIRKAKGNPNKNIHSKKKNSNYGGYTTGAYMAQKVAEKVNQQEKVKLPAWLNVTLIAEFAVVLVILILRLTAFKDSAVMTHLSSLTLGITAARCSISASTSTRRKPAPCTASSPFCWWSCACCTPPSAFWACWAFWAERPAP